MSEKKDALAKTETSWVKPLENVEARDQRKHGWFALDHTCLDDLCRLGADAVAIYALLASYANRKRSDACRPTLSSISLKLKMGKSKVIITLKALVEQGFIGFTQGGSHKPSVYTIVDRPMHVKSTVLDRTESTVLSGTVKPEYGPTWDRKTESTVPDRTAKDKEEREEEKEETRTAAVPFSPSGEPSPETRQTIVDNNPSGQRTIPPRWKDFAGLYPEHRRDPKNDEASRQAWRDLSVVEQARACAALAEHLKSPKWLEEGGKYVPGQAKYLLDEEKRYWRNGVKPNHSREVERMWEMFITVGNLAKSVNKLTPERRAHMSHRYEEAVAMRSEAEAMELIGSAISAYFADRRRQKNPDSANLDALFGSAENFERWAKRAA